MVAQAQPLVGFTDGEGLRRRVAARRSCIGLRRELSAVPTAVIPAASTCDTAMPAYEWKPQPILRKEATGGGKQVCPVGWDRQRSRPCACPDGANLQAVEGGGIADAVPGPLLAVLGARDGEKEHCRGVLLLTAQACAPSANLVGSSWRCGTEGGKCPQGVVTTSAICWSCCSGGFTACPMIKLPTSKVPAAGAPSPDRPLAAGGPAEDAGGEASVVLVHGSSAAVFAAP